MHYKCDFGHIVAPGHLVSAGGQPYWKAFCNDNIRWEVAPGNYTPVCDPSKIFLKRLICPHIMASNYLQLFYSFQPTKLLLAA